jgi:hypothetical protein
LYTPQKNRKGLVYLALSPALPTAAYAFACA